MAWHLFWYAAYEWQKRDEQLLCLQLHVCGGDN
jgi:hypothetical protein